VIHFIQLSLLGKGYIPWNWSLQGGGALVVRMGAGGKLVKRFMELRGSLTRWVHWIYMHDYDTWLRLVIRYKTNGHEQS